MINKMEINTYLSTVESKNQTKQTRRTRQNHGYRGCFDDCQMGGRCAGMGEEVTGLTSTNRQLQNSHGDVQYSIGNGVAEELICMTHGHEQWWGDCLREYGVLGGGVQRGKIRITIIP